MIGAAIAKSAFANALKEMEKFEVNYFVGMLVSRKDVKGICLGLTQATRAQLLEICLDEILDRRK